MLIDPLDEMDANPKRSDDAARWIIGFVAMLLVAGPVVLLAMFCVWLAGKR